MSCNPERVTAFVDGELRAGLSAEVKGHLRICKVCGPQAGFEAALRERLQTLAPPEPPPSLAPRILRAVTTGLALSAGVF